MSESTDIQALRVEEKQRELIRAYHRVFESSDGKKILADLSVPCSEFQSTYVPGDPYATVLNEGARRVLLRIQAILRKNPDEDKPRTALTQEPTDA